MTVVCSLLLVGSRTWCALLTEAECKDGCVAGSTGTFWEYWAAESDRSRRWEAWSLGSRPKPLPPVDLWSCGGRQLGARSWGCGSYRAMHWAGLDSSNELFRVPHEWIGLPLRPPCLWMIEGLMLVVNAAIGLHMSTRAGNCRRFMNLPPGEHDSSRQEQLRDNELQGNVGFPLLAQA